MDARTTMGGAVSAAAGPDAGMTWLWPRTFTGAELSGAGEDPVTAGLLTESVAQPLWALMDRGGGRWRPRIARLAYEACNGRDAMPAALFDIVELLHLGSLVVDDIEDGATERRNGPAAHIAHGVPVALNAANAAYFRALQALREMMPGGPARLRMMDMLAEELWQAHLGQAMDLSLVRSMEQGNPVTVDHYLAMAGAKTGALVRMSARLGAIAAGADSDTEAALSRWATAFGVAYQVTDDTKDLQEDSARPGSCCLSYPVILALQQLQGNDQQVLRACLGLPSSAPTPAEPGAVMLRMLDERGAVRTAWEDAATAAREAAAALKDLPGAGELVRLTHAWIGGGKS